MDVPKYILSLQADIYEDNFVDVQNPPPYLVAPFTIKVSRLTDGPYTVEGIEPVSGRVRFSLDLGQAPVDALIEASLLAGQFKIIRNQAGTPALATSYDDDHEVSVVVISDPNPGPKTGPKDMALAPASKRQKRSASVASKTLARRRRKLPKAG